MWYVQCRRRGQGVFLTIFFCILSNKLLVHFCRSLQLLSSVHCMPMSPSIIWRLSKAINANHSIWADVCLDQSSCRTTSCAWLCASLFSDSRNVFFIRVCYGIIYSIYSALFILFTWPSYYEYVQISYVFWDACGIRERLFSLCVQCIHVFKWHCFWVRYLIL